MNPNMLIAMDIVLSLIKAATDAAAVIAKARAEGRDISDAELAELRAARQAASDELQG